MCETSKSAAGISASLMLRYDRLVLDWHLITSKRDHLAAMSTVPCVERCFGELESSLDSLPSLELTLTWVRVSTKVYRRR